MNTDIAPRKIHPNSDHEHKFFAFQVKNLHEPVVIDGKTYYQDVEYGYSGCNCGAMVRVKIRTQK
jgi:hypothetical protein